MSDEVLYSAVVDVTGGRAGHAVSRTGELDVRLARPAQRATGEGTDPEELFAAGYAACFDSALAVAARQRRVRLGPTTTTASVSLCASPEQQYYLRVRLEVSASECSLTELRETVELADTLCPYSNGIRGNVDVAFSLRGAEQQA